MLTQPGNIDHGLHQVAVSDVGMRRPANQDAHAERLESNEDWPRRGHLFIVADGMGAHAAGELASQQAVEEIIRHYQPADSLPAQEAIIHAIETANASIYRRGHEDTELYNMGTTCSTLVLLPEGAVVAHVGDSRVYRWRNNRIQQLTFDHSLVWEMRAAGQLAKDDERNSIVPRNVITRCLGPHPEVQVDREGPFSVQLGDVFLLCSDGLTGRISDAEIGSIIGNLPPEMSATLLVDLANLRGGNDNITVIVISITGSHICTPTSRDSVSDVGDPSAPATKPHQAWWAVLVVGLIATVACLALGQVPLALISAVAMVASVTAIAIPALKPRRPVGTTSLGEAPYETTHCPIDQEFLASLVNTFTATLDELTTLPDDEVMKLREEVEHLRAKSAENAASIGDRLSRLAAQLMSAVRREQQSMSDSSIR